MKLIKKTVAYLQGSKQELKKVVWPSKKETTNHTLIVIGVSLVMAAFLGAVDFVLTIIIEVIV